MNVRRALTGHYEAEHDITQGSGHMHQRRSFQNNIDLSIIRYRVQTLQQGEHFGLALRWRQVESRREMLERNDSFFVIKLKGRVNTGLALNVALHITC